MSETKLSPDYNVVLHRGLTVGDDVVVSWCYPEVDEMAPIRLRVIDVDDSEAEAYLTVGEAEEVIDALREAIEQMQMAKPTLDEVLRAAATTKAIEKAAASR